MMLCNVSTWWNSTYDMVRFAYVYQLAIDCLTSWCDLDLQKYELTDEEWELVKQLCDTLKICRAHLSYYDIDLGLQDYNSLVLK